MYAYKSLKTPSNTGSGVADSFLFAPISAFTEISCPVGPFTNPGDEVTITTPHTFGATDGFIEVICAPFKNQLTASTIGDIGTQKLEQKLEVFVTGSYPELHEYAKNALNVPCLILIKDSECAADFYYQLGCDCVYAWMTAEFTTGTTRDGAKGYKLTFTVASSAILSYKAAVTMKP